MGYQAKPAPASMKRCFLGTLVDMFRVAVSWIQIAGLVPSRLSKSALHTLSCLLLDGPDSVLACSAAEHCFQAFSIPLCLYHAVSGSLPFPTKG